MKYQWAIFRREDIWTGPMSLAECRAWIEEWILDGGRPDAFRLKRRAVGEWEDEE